MRRSIVSLMFGVTLICSVPKSAKADMVNVVGAISDGYGAFQAAQFVISIFELGGSGEFGAAVSELESFMQTYRDQALVNNVHADLQLFQFISSNYQSGLTNDLEGNFISQCINDLSQLQGDIQNGTTSDAYMLAPAYNLLTVTFVGAVTAFGMINPANAYPASTLNSYFSSAFSTNYPLVGAFIVTYDVFNFGGGLTGMVGTQGGKKMWPKYASTYYGFNAQRFISPALGYELGTYYCDLTQSANADDNLMSYCFFRTAPLSTPLSVGTPPDPYLTAARNQLTYSRQNFNADQSVQAVQASIRGLMTQGYSEVTDWDTGGLYPFAIGHIVIE